MRAVFIMRLSPPAKVCHAAVLDRYYTLLKREMRSEVQCSPEATDAALQHSHTFIFARIEHALMKRLQHVSDREFVQISCIVSVAPPPSDSSSPLRKLRVIMETSHSRTVPPPPLSKLNWRICDNKFIEE
jgi:hypothetical protein